MFKSQIGQDKWVHSIIGDKRNGFFIECGASDGILYSNTYFFEKCLDWDGICIEPNPHFRDQLEKNRMCKKCFFCVSDIDDQYLDFNLDSHTSGVVSSGGCFVKQNDVIRIKTKTLKTILDMYDAPKVIDYLSLDVEGYEYTILQNFPFDDYIIHCITVEHNEPHQGPEMRIKLRNLLEKNSYVFVKGNDNIHGWGHGPIDDFYIHSSFLIPSSPRR